MASTWTPSEAVQATDGCGRWCADRLGVCEDTWQAGGNARGDPDRDVAVCGLGGGDLAEYGDGVVGRAMTSTAFRIAPLSS